MKSNHEYIKLIYRKGWQVFFIMAMLIFAVSCQKNFLDQSTLSVLNEQAIFADSTYSQQYINSRYTNISYSWEPGRFGTGGLESACDEAESATSPTQYHYIISSGAANPSNTDKGLWTTVYAQVRAINIFLRNEAGLPVTQTIKNRWEGEVRFLRAWYYAALLKHYGGFPIVGDTVFADGDVINVPRSSYDSSVNYIVTECDAAAKLLPLNYLSSGVATVDYGRATQGAALGLKARVLLYAASPLSNATRADDPNHLVSYPGADINRWKLAADAAQAVINLNQYSLYNAVSPGIYQTFLVNQNAEQVFAYFPPTTTSNNMYRETMWNSPSRGTKYTGTITGFPLQELVDAFGMQNGLSITDPASGYSGVGNNMYLNRDPRFYSAISFNGSLRALSGYTGDQPIRTYTGVLETGNANLNSANLDGIYKTNATKTGYYGYKMLADGVINGGSELNRPRLLIRYAEILLNAAEATNEFSGPSTQVYNWLTMIRSRAGITAGTNGLYGMKANMTQNEMRSFIQSERRVELAFEEHRFWDIRRWKIAMVTENQDMHGMEITRAADGSYSYRSIVIRKHVFTNNMYFWPIPQSELTKSSALKQNPGY